MFRWSEPNTAQIRDDIQRNVGCAFSYPEVGLTHTSRRVRGYNTDRRRIRLGDGEETYAIARKALSDWRQFTLDWVRLCWPYKRIQPGTTAGVLCHHYLVWSLNVVRIVYLVDETTPAYKRFGFAYGTLPQHVCRGEERFQVEMREDGSVWFEIVAFSRPAHWAAWLFYPYARYAQKKFSKQAARAFLDAVQAGERPRQSQPLSPSSLAS